MNDTNATPIRRMNERWKKRVHMLRFIFPFDGFRMRRWQRLPNTVRPKCICFVWFVHFACRSFSSFHAVTSTVRHFTLATEIQHIYTRFDIVWISSFVSCHLKRIHRRRNKKTNDFLFERKIFKRIEGAQIIPRLPCVVCLELRTFGLQQHKSKHTIYLLVHFHMKYTSHAS